MHVQVSARSPFRTRDVPDRAKEPQFCYDQSASSKDQPFFTDSKTLVRVCRRWIDAQSLGKLSVKESRNVAECVIPPWREPSRSKAVQLLGNVRRDTKIYKILKREYFYELFGERKNALVLPKKWHDPFENVILNAKVRTASGETGKFAFHEDVYGQCWTLHTASDAMWQIYSEKKDAVRIRTTVGKLVDSLRSAHGKWADETCFIGKVDYLGEERLKKFARTVFKDGITPHTIARSLLVKRNAYKHEREVRLIYIERNNKKHANGVYKYEVDPHTLIDQVMIDPRVTYEEFLPLKDRMIKRTGLSERQIKRSLLYRQPKGFIVEIP